MLVLEVSALLAVAVKRPGATNPSNLDKACRPPTRSHWKVRKGFGVGAALAIREVQRLCHGKKSQMLQRSGIPQKLSTFWECQKRTQNQNPTNTQPKPTKTNITNITNTNQHQPTPTNQNQNPTQPLKTHRTTSPPQAMGALPVALGSWAPGVALGRRSLPEVGCVFVSEGSQWSLFWCFFAFSLC